MAIRNRLKQTISASVGAWAVTNGIRAKHQAVRQWRRWDPKGGGLLDPTSVGEENKTFLIRVWKPLPSRSVSGGLGLLQMVSEPNTKRCAQRGRWDPKGGGLWDPTSVGEENETFLIRVWKPLPSRYVLKPWGWTVICNELKQTISASGGLGLLHYYLWLCHTKPRIAGNSEGEPSNNVD